MTPDLLHRARERLILASLALFVAVAATIDLSAFLRDRTSPLAALRRHYADLCDPLYAVMPASLWWIHLAHLAVMCPLALASIAALRRPHAGLTWALWAFAGLGLAVDLTYYAVEFTAPTPPTDLATFLACTAPYPACKLLMLWHLTRSPAAARRELDPSGSRASERRSAPPGWEISRSAHGRINVPARRDPRMPCWGRPPPRATVCRAPADISCGIL